MTTFELFILLAILFLNLYWIFFKSYSTEKGKNTATKEDIEEITTKIESVKIELEQLHSKKKDYSEQNKLALLTFYDEYLDWNEHSIKNVCVTINDLYSPEKIREQMDLVNLQQLKVQKAFWRLCLFEIQNTEFVKQINEIYLETEKMHDATLEYLYEMEHLSITFKVHDKSVFSPRINSEFGKFTDALYEKREKSELIIIDLPNKLMNIIRKRFIELYS